MESLSLLIVSILVFLMSGIVSGAVAWTVTRARGIRRQRVVTDFLIRGGHTHARRKTRRTALGRILNALPE